MRTFVPIYFHLYLQNMDIDFPTLKGFIGQTT